MIQSNRGAAARWGMWAITLGIGCCTPLAAQEAPQPVYIVTHVDLAGPGAAAEGTKLLLEFAGDSRKDKGVLRFEVWREPTRLNHLTLIQAWQTPADFEAHRTAAHTKSFREKIQPFLGSPFDERLHTLLP
jgi:quinol monooxygenase YgiN